jgi:hypothetical protein
VTTTGRRRGPPALSHLVYPLLFTLWYIVYFYLLQPPLLRRLEALSRSPDLGLGLLLLSLQLLEVLGLWLKYPAVRWRMRHYPTTSAAGAFLTFMSVLGHMGLTTGLLSFTTLSAFGVELTGEPAVVPIVLALLFFFAMLTKEGFLLGFVLKYPLPVSGFNQRFPRASEYVADVILALFDAVAYTVVWQRSIATSFLTATTLGGRIVEYLGAVLFFGLVFPALHPLAVADVWLVQRSRRERALSGASFLITMVAAITGIPRRPPGR